VPPVATVKKIKKKEEKKGDEVGRGKADR